MVAVLGKSHLTQIIAGTTLSLLSLVSIVLYTDPYSATLVTHSVFYLSLFFFGSGTAVMAGLGVRRLISQQLYVVSFFESFRQGLLIGVLIVSSLLLQSQGLLYWWVVLGLVLFLAVIELLFST